VIPPRAGSRVGCRVWAGCAILLGGVLLAQAEAKALRSFGNDFTAYLAAASALAAGANPYLVSPRFPYSYPLTLAWLFVPLTALPIWLAAAAWFGASLAAYWRLVREAAVAGGRQLSACETVALAAIVAVALLQILQNELLNGQINLAVAAITLAAAALSERGRPVPAAMLWGLGVALKLFPLILAPWFLVRRRWTELSIGIVTAVALCLFPVVWAGSDALTWTLDYFGRISTGQAGAADVPDFVHLNAAWMIARLAGFSATPPWLFAAACVALMGIAIAVDIRSAPSAGAGSAVMYLSLVVLVSPKSETHHMVFTIPAVILLAVRARSAAALLPLAGLVVLFNVGFVTPSLRDPLLLAYALGTSAWCAYDVARR